MTELNMLYVNNYWAVRDTEGNLVESFDCSFYGDQIAKKLAETYMEAFAKGYNIGYDEAPIL